MVDKPTWISIKSREKEKARVSKEKAKEKESQIGNPVMEKEEDTKAEDVASKEEEKVVALVVTLEKEVENTTRKEVTGKVSALKQRDMRTDHTRQVQEDQQSSAGVSQAPTTAPSTTTTTTQQTRTTNNTRLNVRQIDMWHIGDEPDQFPESFVFSGSEEELEIDYFGRILAARASAVQPHCMRSEDEEDAISLHTSDSLMLWWYDFNDFLHAHAVSSSQPVSGKATQIVLDSGADVSLLPRNVSFCSQQHENQ